MDGFDIPLASISNKGPKMKTFYLLNFAVGLALCVISSAALAIQPGTNGTEKRFQQSGLRSAVLLQQNLTATASSGAATLNAAGSGIVTTESVTTAAGADYTLTLTNNMISAGDIVLTSLQNGSNSAGIPTITTVTSSSNQVVILVHNFHASAAFNGTLKISFLVIKQNANGND
jgi:hypothetical protein